MEIGFEKERSERDSLAASQVNGKRLGVHGNIFRMFKPYCFEDRNPHC